MPHGRLHLQSFFSPFFNNILRPPASQTDSSLLRSKERSAQLCFRGKNLGKTSTSVSRASAPLACEIIWPTTLADVRFLQEREDGLSSVFSATLWLSVSRWWNPPRIPMIRARRTTDAAVYRGVPSRSRAPHNPPTAVALRSYPGVMRTFRRKKRIFSFPPSLTGRKEGRLRFSCREGN